MRETRVYRVSNRAYRPSCSGGVIIVHSISTWLFILEWSLLNSSASVLALEQQIWLNKGFVLNGKGEEGVLAELEDIWMTSLEEFNLGTLNGTLLNEHYIVVID